MDQKDERISKYSNLHSKDVNNKRINERKDNERKIILGLIIP